MGAPLSEKRLQRENALVPGCSNSQHNKAAALLAFQLGHNAATPT